MGIPGNVKADPDALKETVSTYNYKKISPCVQMIRTKIISTY